MLPPATGTGCGRSAVREQPWLPKADWLRLLAHRSIVRVSGGRLLELEDVLRDALADLLAEEAQYGPVVDRRGTVTGVLSIEILSQALKADPEQVPSGADAL